MCVCVHVCVCVYVCVSVFCTCVGRWIAAVDRMPPPLPVPPLSGADVGISEFVSGEDVPGIGGRVKCFPEDFQVNEVRLRDGSVVKASFDMVQADAEGRLILGTDHWAQAKEDAQGCVKDPLRRHCPKPGEDCFRFTMIKRQADTLEALAELSRVCGVAPRTFSFCGIKDSWAVTAQEVCANIADITPIDIARAVQHSIPWMRVENFRMISSAEGPLGWLAPGRLLGNRFSIIIRCACAPAAVNFTQGGGVEEQVCETAEAVDEAVTRAVKHVEHFGFINYVGLQRFAKGGVRSDLVGLAYLRTDYPQCIDAMLTGMARNPAECAEGRQGLHAISRSSRTHWVDVWKRTNSPTGTFFRPTHCRRLRWLHARDTHAHAHKGTQTRARTRVCALSHAHLHTYARTHAIVLACDTLKASQMAACARHTHARTQTHTHTHTHMCILSLPHTLAHTPTHARNCFCVRHTAGVSATAVISARRTHTPTYTHTHPDTHTHIPFLSLSLPHVYIFFGVRHTACA